MLAAHKLSIGDITISEVPAPGRSHGQWNPLWPWLAERRELLEAGLQGGLIRFGELCHARHTVPYDALPDWFLGFDVYDASTGQFWSADRRNALLAKGGLHPIPEVARGRFALDDLPHLLEQSAVGNIPMEGIDLRREQGGVF